MAKAAKPKPSRTRLAAVASRERLAASPTVRVQPPRREDLLSTGCTLLNMAFSGIPGGGVPKGTYLYFVGDSGSAKTWFTFNLFAEACRNPHFADYRLVFDNAENGALMDVARYFGAAVVERLEPPAPDVPGSETIQEFYYHLETNTRRPCIYVLDSMDALNDDADEERFAAELRRHENGTGEVPGSMGMAKAKTNSKHINRVVKSLRRSGSILVVISQTRDMVGGRFPGMKTRSGGRALRFFAHLEAWTSVRGAITRTYLRKEREIGAYIGIDVQKNRVSGWEGKLPLIPFLKGHGLDDMGALVDYLLDERHWAKVKKVGADTRDDDEAETGGRFAAPEFDFVGTREQLIKKLQDAGEEWELSRIAATVWREIIAGAAPSRKPRYMT